MSNFINIYKLGFSQFSGNNGRMIINTEDLDAAGCQSITGITCDPAGIIYITDSVSHAIFKCLPTGEASLFAGLPGVSGNNSNQKVILEDARFNSPSGISCDKSDNIYVADSGNNQIRKIYGGVYVTLLAGDPNCTSGFVSGNVLLSKFNSPQDVAIDSSGKIWVADTMNHAIRFIYNNMVYTVAGNGTPGNISGSALTAKLNRPIAIMPRADGRICIADTGNRQIKMFDFVNVWPFCGNGSYGTYVGIAYQSQFQEILYGDVDSNGNIYIIDFDIVDGIHSRLMKINNDGSPRVIVHFEDEFSGSVRALALDRSENMFVGFSPSNTEILTSI